MTRKGWDVSAERPEINPEVPRNLNARNNLRNEQDEDHQSGDFPSHNVHDNWKKISTQIACLHRPSRKKFILAWVKIFSFIYPKCLFYQNTWAGKLYCRRLPPVTELEFRQQLLAKMWLLEPYPFIKSKLKLFTKLFHCLCVLLPCYFKNYPKGPYWDIFPITEPKMFLLFIYRQP